MEEKKETALLWPGGGTRNGVVTSALIGAELKPEQFSAIFTNSSSVVPAALFMAGQIDQTDDIWKGGVSRFEAFSIRHWWKTGWLVNVDYCVAYCLSHLDREAFGRSPVKLYASTFRQSDGRTVYHRVTPDNIGLISKASAAMPGIAKPVRLPEEEGLHLDGGVSDLIPVLAALMCGYRKMLAGLNRPLQEFRREPTKALAYCLFPRHREARHAFLNNIIDDAIRFLEEPPEGIEVELLQAPNLPFSRFCKPTEIDIICNTGRQLGVRERQRIHTFLER
jgi:predicted patatin/cPLA2 family phospholipase